MAIAVTKMPMPPKSSPSRSSELRKQLIRIQADTEECVLLFPDESADLAKLRNRASGAVAAVRDAEGCFFVTRTTKAVDPYGESDEPVTCVGIWKTSKDPNEGKAPRKPKASKPANGETKAASSNGNGKANGNGNGKAKAEPETKPEGESKQGTLDSLG